MNLTQQGKLFLDRHYLEIKPALVAETCQLLSQRVWALSKSGKLMDCPVCVASSWAYGDEFFEEVHKELCQQLSKYLGIKLLTSFNCVRFYPEHEVLEKHIDREAAEFSMSITVDFKGEEEWPIYFSENEDSGEEIKVSLNTGEAVLFQGSKLYHWRKPLKNQWQIQAFFFFVDADGQYKGHKADAISYPKRQDEKALFS